LSFGNIIHRFSSGTNLFKLKFSYTRFFYSDTNTVEGKSHNETIDSFISATAFPMGRVAGGRSLWRTQNTVPCRNTVTWRPVTGGRQHRAPATLPTTLPTCANEFNCERAVVAFSRTGFNLRQPPPAHGEAQWNKCTPFQVSPNPVFMAKTVCFHFSTRLQACREPVFHARMAENALTSGLHNMNHGMRNASAIKHQKLYYPITTKRLQ